MYHFLPAEWAPQSAVLLTWPHAHGDWGEDLAAAEQVFLAMAAAVARHEKVVISCHDEVHLGHVKRLLADAGVAIADAMLQVVPSNDVWVRDHGPLTVLREGRPILLDFRFNGWGRKYPHRLDDAVCRELHRQGVFGDTPMESQDLVLEGGSIESDGAGTLLTTKECLLSPERNPEYDCVGLEGVFAKTLGAERVLWLDHGYLAGDDTDGHVDTLARFCDPTTIAYVSGPAGPDQQEGLQAMEEQLRSFRTGEGRPYRLVPLPLPSPKRDRDGRILPATYANFLIINDAVLVPTYDDPMDAIALERLATCFPDRELVAIDALALITQAGSIHCATMQVPAGVVPA